MVENLPTASTTQKMIGALCSQNNSNTSSIKQCKKDGSGEPVRDEVDDAISSHQKSIFLVQSRLGQEEGQTTMVDSGSMAAPATVTIGTNHTQNTMDTPFKNNFDK